MKNKLPHLLLLLTLTGSAVLQTAQSQNHTSGIPGKKFNIVFYNVENLFDTENDPAKNDDEFTPSGKIPWTSERFQVKIKHLAQVISSVNMPDFPDIIGLSEIENDFVLNKLIEANSLNKIGYKIVHYESPDERGIDVALLYNPVTFTVTESKPIPVNLPDNDLTRDILYVKGTTAAGNELHVFVNHWPSRSEGIPISEPKRKLAAQVLKSEVDNILKKDSRSNIVIIGDFNEEPTDNSLSVVLDAQQTEKKIRNSTLYNLMFPLQKKGKGSLYYNDWNMFDQVIVSGNLLLSKKINCAEDSVHIFDASWLMFKDPKKGVMRPNRTLGAKYFGGYSDHLPVFISLHEEN